MKPLIVVYSLLMMLFCCSCGSGHPDRRVTEENAYEGVSNYCHQMYEWSIAQENPSIMYVEMGVESDSTYEVVFRSYTFYVDKHTGVTRMVEKVPLLDIENETGRINLFDYLKKE